MSSGFICSDIHNAFFELLSASEVKKISVCHIVSSITFESTGDAKRGGLHDPSMGPLDIRDFCTTCGGRSECPGHIGHIELELPVYHPLYIRQLVNLLKSICWHCCTLRICQDTCKDYIKRLLLLKESRYTDNKHFLSDRRATTHAEYADNCSKLICDSNSQLNQPSNILSVDQRANILPNDDIDIRTFISSDGYALELWNNLRSEFFNKAIKQKACSNCGKSFRATVKESQLSIGITLSWPESSKSPIGLGSTWGNYNLKEGQIKIEDDFSSEVPDQAKIHTKKGQSLISQHFQAFQVVPILKRLWENNEKILEFLFPMSREISWEMFFMFVIPVPANKFRPLGALGGRNIPLLHPRTSALLDILVANERLRFYIDLQRQNKDKSTDDIGGSSSQSGLLSYVSSLQERVNSYLDKNKSFKPASTPPGIRQWLERKTGVIRQKMMGKRVNYSARTVIGPDPYLETNEIGIPLMFAKNLTIPEYVGTHNVLIMCKLVENGTDHYPGATKLQLDGTLYDLSRLNISQRISKSKLLLSSVFTSLNPLIQNNYPIVFRQVIDGDVVLMNRQPTLHRPSIMAHFVRILPKDNIMRLNYVNCGTYNADFDGDEMNLHLPQSLSSRSEAKYIMDASQQYSVPKSGEPLRGLIQDSCIGGAFLTSKSTFLNREEYYHLLYTSLSFILDVKSSALSSLPIMYSANGHVIFGKNNTSSQLNTASGTVTIDETILRFQSHKNNRREFTSSTNLDGVILEPPAIFKPIPLWTGKQVVTSMLKTFINKTSSSDRKIYAGINLISKSRTPGDSWNGINDGDSEESTVIIRNSELLQGVIDKNQFGTNTYCLVHLCTDLFGPVIGGRLLSSFFYLSQAFLQIRGFTCSIGDMLLTLEAEKRRKDIINKCTNASVFLQEAFSNLVLQRINNDYEISMEYSLPSIECKFTDQLKNICDFSGTSYTKFVESPKSQVQTLKIIIDKLSEYYKSNTDVDNKIMIRELTKYTNLFNFLNFNSHPTGLSTKIKSNYSKPCNLTLKDGNNQIPYYYQSWLVNRLENATCPNNKSYRRNFFLVYPNEVTRRRVEFVVGKLLSQTTSSVMKIIDTFCKMGIGNISSQVGEIVNGSSTFLPFPKNGFSSMVITGAKGSRVNHQMICAMLGQQELEGRRVPIMISMKSLPAFAPYDFGSRAGGFITDRYLDGLHAQEFFFHCMSGREGLVDTAVKTARSGYLQRCILKGLESMIVQYDGTVRSDDGSMIQFIYGEDGIDVSKCSYIARVDDLARNIELLSRSLNACEAKRNDVVRLSFSKVLEIENKYGQFATAMNRSNKEKKARSNSRGYFSWEVVKMDESDTPITSVLPPAEYCGSVSELFVSNLTENNLQRLSHLCNNHQSINTKVERLKYENKRKNGDSYHNLEELKNIEYLLRLKYSQTQVAPGEAVGCLAAQSIGEPATQMTLNTFHLAGHGAANVTLGIPRLRELLQTGGESKTPYSFIPLNVKGSMNQLQAANAADQVLACFKSIPLTDIIAAIGVDNSIIYDCVGQYNNSKPSYCWRYDLTIQFEDLDSFCKVVPGYSISNIINQIFSKCLRPFLRQVNSMFILSCLKCRTNSRFSYLHDEVDEFTYKYIYGCRSYKEERRNIETYKGSSNNLSNIEQESNNIDIAESSQDNKEIENDYVDIDTPRERSDGSSDSETELKSIGTDDEYSDEEKIANINENSEIEVDGDSIVNEAKSEDISFSFADTEDLSSHAIRLKILSPILLRHVWDIKLSRLTNSLKVTIGWPIESCPNRIDLLPELSHCISKAHLRSVENLKNARITRCQQSEDNTLEVTVQGTNIGYIYNISPDLVLHNNIRSNDIQTVYKYYGIEAARKCLINELTNVFAVYGINVDYRHLSLIGDTVTFSGSIRVFSRVGNVAHSTSPFLQMSFETSIKFLADACSRGAIDSLKSPASSISVGKICSVGTGLSRIFTIVNHSNKSNVFKEIYGKENDHRFRFVSN